MTFLTLCFLFLFCFLRDPLESAKLSGFEEKQKNPKSKDVLIIAGRAVSSLCQALGQCRRAKKAGEQWKSKRAKNGGKREDENL